MSLLHTKKQRHCARKKVRYALQTGKLVRPVVCEYADCPDTPTEAHHPDYDYPLDVLWFCRRHHVECHGKVYHEQ